MSNDIKRRTIPSVGVVLTGGGMRGPFQAGVLEGLESSGITISVISGTSAGALNALSFIRSGPKATSEKWRVMSHQRLLTINIRGLVVRVTLLFFSLRHAIWFLIIHWKDHLDPSTDRITRAATWLRHFIQEWEIDQPFLSAYSNRTTARAMGVSFLISFIPVFLLAIVCLFISTLLFSAFVILGVIVFFFAGRIWRLVNKRGLTTLNTKLREVLASIQFEDTRNIIAFACIAMPKSGFDYRDMNGYYFLVPAMTSLGYMGNIIRGDVDAIERNILTPKYIRIDTLAPPEQENIAAASAALPLGLIGNVTYGDSFAFDGGIVDNVPVYPVIDSGVDCIVVVDITRKGLGKQATAILNSHVNQMRYLRAISGDVSRLLKRGKLLCKAARRYFISFSQTHQRINNKLDNLLGLNKTLELPRIFIARPQIKSSWHSLLYSSRRETDALIKCGQSEGVKLGAMIQNHVEGELIANHEEV